MQPSAGATARNTLVVLAVLAGVCLGLPVLACFFFAFIGAVSQ